MAKIGPGARLTRERSLWRFACHPERSGCHPEEHSDEGSAVHQVNSRSFASLRMTVRSGWHHEVSLLTTIRLHAQHEMHGLW